MAAPAQRVDLRAGVWRLGITLVYASPYNSVGCESAFLSAIRFHGTGLRGR